VPKTATDEIPYERQSDPTSNRMCGAAALCMVYRSFGVACSQSEVAAKVVKPTASGNNTGARTYLLAQDALARGLAALVFRARDPLRTLRDCQDRPLRLILNHRLGIESPTGHFTVFVGIADEHVVVHDPQVGPRTRMLRSDLLKLWQPLGSLSEITGNVLVALANKPDAAGACPKCGTSVPDTVACPACQKLVPLHPNAVLGCMNVSCPERAWETIFCPYCDQSVVAVAGGAFGSPRGTRPMPTEDDPRGIKPFNQEINNFIALLLSTNDGKPVPGSEAVLAQIRGVQQEMLAWQEKDAAQRRAKAAAPPPSPPPPPPAPEPPKRKPVDWNALGRTLLKEVGIAEARPGEPKKGRAPGKSAKDLTDSGLIEVLKKKGLVE
jgi:hypothetical protein